MEVSTPLIDTHITKKQIIMIHTNVFHHFIFVNDRYRESELKHGRVAMLAVLGVLVGESGFTFFGDEIAGPAIFQYQV
jgi:hypothetical protein